MRSWEGKGNEHVLSIMLAAQADMQAIFQPPSHDFVPKFTPSNLQTKCLL